VVYNNAYRDPSIVVQPQIDGGVRMITVVDSPKAPTSFDYPVTVDQGQSMALTADGGAVVTGQDGATVFTVVAPWAYDVNGTPVAADYTLTGTTLTLNIHPTDTTAYPIIADPKFVHGIITGTFYMSKGETEAIAASGATLVPELLAGFLVGPFAPYVTYVASVAANIQLWAMIAVFVNAFFGENKCLKVKVGVTWSWKGLTPGVTPGHYTCGTR